MADLKLPDFLHEVADAIKREHPDSTVILFGSYARGEQHEDSDLDFCVLVPELTQRRTDMRVEMRGLIGDICYDNDFPFDLKLYTYDEFEKKSRLRSTLQHTIMVEGVTLSGKQKKRGRPVAAPLRCFGYSIGSKLLMWISPAWKNALFAPKTWAKNWKGT